MFLSFFFILFSSKIERQFKQFLHAIMYVYYRSIYNIFKRMQRPLGMKFHYHHFRFWWVDLKIRRAATKCYRHIDCFSFNIRFMVLSPICNNITYLFFKMFCFWPRSYVISGNSGVVKKWNPESKKKFKHPYNWLVQVI